MHTFWLSLYMQQDYAETSSDERSWGATESIPILTEACNQFQARTSKIFFPRPEFVSAIPVQHTKDPVKAEVMRQRADRVGRHMSWQLGFQNKKYRRDKNALFLGTAVHGSFFTKTYFDAVKTKRARIDNVRPTDFLVNYTVGPVDIDDVRRKTHIIYSTVGDTQRLANQDYLVEAAKSSQTSGQNAYNTRVDETQGLTPGHRTLRRDEPTTLYEQHFYLDINEDGNFLPYIGTIDYDSGKLLRLTIGYEAKPDGTPIKDYEQIQYFTHYKFAENPDGFYGLGLGHMIGDLNSAVNIIYRQAIDAGTLANDGNSSGFISERIALDQGDEMSLTLGKFKKVPAQVDDLSKAIMQMKFPGPSEAMVKLGEYLDTRAQRLGATNEATTGASTRAEQPTTLLAQIEQSLELFSSVQMNLADSLGDELTKIARINRKYLPLVEYYAINDVTDAVTRSDYADDMLIQPIFDPKFSTRAQKVAKAQAEVQATMQNPLSQTRPQVYDIAFRRYLEALDTENVDELIPPTPIEMIVDATQAQQAATGGQANTGTPAIGGQSPAMAAGQDNGMGDTAPAAPVPGAAPVMGGGNMGEAAPAFGATAGV